MVVNKPNIYRQMCRQCDYVRGLEHMAQTLLTTDGLRESKVSWARFGATVSLVLAAHLGARQIDCFGVDWDGEEDFDGFTSEKNRRTDSRWKREIGIWDQLCHILSDHGVTVTRCGI